MFTLNLFIALLRKEWNLDHQPEEEECSSKRLKREKVKCFGIQPDEDHGVLMKYRGSTFHTNEFCLRINPNANSPTDHIAEVCTKKIRGPFFAG